jgi:hypothetical protein
VAASVISTIDQDAGRSLAFFLLRAMRMLRRGRIAGGWGDNVELISSAHNPAQF